MKEFKIKQTKPTGQVMSRDFFFDKWYIREDFFPEPFQDKWNKDFCNSMLHINCFDTREDALEACNAIRSLFGIDTYRGEVKTEIKEGAPKKSTSRTVHKLPLFSVDHKILELRLQLIEVEKREQYIERLQNIVDVFTDNFEKPRLAELSISSDTLIAPIKFIEDKMRILDVVNLIINDQHKYLEADKQNILNNNYKQP
ncbi:MAG: hypothetical protein PHS04_09830 [Tissierellia bacterium]|nr:hypothetical protein [Tissierellia bacterium]